MEPGELSDTLKRVTGQFYETEGAENIAAREIMVALTKKEEDEEEVIPSIAEQFEGEAPVLPNVFSDGSVKNTKGPFWHLGGAGVWWPERKAESITEQEKKISRV